MKLACRLSMALIVLSVSPALASFGNDKGSTTPAPSSSSTPTSSDPAAQKASARQEAERWYHDAYQDIEKAKVALDAKKAADAEKKLRRALERGEKATALDPAYHEAWNLVGYAARKLKDYDRAVAAYQRCLKLKTDYAPAREYLGEAYLEMGKIGLAKDQLAAIDATAAPEEARTLSAAIADWEKKNGKAAGGETGNATPAAAAASDDKK